jgi:tetratricopeptide (TPR) repeat protein
MCIRSLFLFWTLSVALNSCGSQPKAPEKTDCVLCTEPKAIIWDVSLSGLQRNLQREIEMLDTVFAGNENACIHLYFLNNTFKEVASGKWDKLKSVLETAVYDGGTDFSKIDLDSISGDEIWFFSDGISTLSDADFLKDDRLNRPIHSIVSSAKADYSTMKLIAGITSGKFVNVNALPSERLRDELQDEMPQFSEAGERNMLKEALAAAKNIKRWWNTDFTSKPQAGEAKGGFTGGNIVRSKRGDINLVRTAGGSEVVCTAGSDDEMKIVAQQNTHTLVISYCGQGWVNNADVEKVLHGTLEAADVKGFMDPSGIICILGADESPFTPFIKGKDNSYLYELTGKTADDYQIYLKSRDNHANLPAFYFDMANWFYKLGDRETALRILTSIADLELENALLYRLLGYKFKEYGEYALEKFVCQKVIQWRNIEPQSYRDYALALADNGEAQAALDTLYSLLTKPYWDNIRKRSRGIEDVVIMEMNHLIAKNPNLNTSEIDKDLLIDIPVDIRVVINWNMSADVDLRVIDPNKEVCYYDHRETHIGGHIGADITEGYGPEQFILKKAIKGKYRIYVGYDINRQFTPANPPTIMAEIFTKYADKTEQRQVITLQMSNSKKYGESVKIAEFEF